MQRPNGKHLFGVRNKRDSVSFGVRSLRGTSLPRFPASKPRKLNPSLSPREERGGEVSHNERSRPGKGHGRVVFGATSAGRRSTWKDKQSGAVVDHVSRRSPFLCLPICPSIFPRVRHFPHGWVLGTSRQGKGSAGKPLFSHLGKGVAEFRRHRSVSSRALTRHISAPVWVGCFRCGFVLRASGWVCVFWGSDCVLCS